jgi:uncharacterized protein (TIGR02453 family)
VRPEWEDLVAMLCAAATTFDPRFVGVDPRTCLFRLARDVRFSADKQPYKTWLGAWLSPFGKDGAHPGFYVQVAGDGGTFAAGVWSPSKPALAALRRHFAGGGAVRLDRILRGARIAPYLPLATDPLRVTPRGIPKEHPRPDLVRARKYMLRRTIPAADLVRDGAFATFRRAMRDCAPFVAALDAVVDGVDPSG